ncbi:MAG: hypothetical protein RLN96_12270, partial [Pseudomonadales bacterium]
RTTTHSTTIRRTRMWYAIISDDDENQGQPKHPEELEIDPERFTEIIGNVDIYDANEHKKRNPYQVKGTPLSATEGRSVAKHSLDNRFVTDPQAAEKYEAYDPIEHRWLPEQEQRIVKEQRRCS